MTTVTAPAAAPPAAPRGRRRIGRGMWLLPPLLALAVIFGYPMLFVITDALSGRSQLTGQSGVAAWQAVLGSAQFQQALARTIEIGVAATAGCLVLGFVLAVVIAFVPFPGSRVIARFIETVLAFPSFLIALSFGYVYGASGLLNHLLMTVTGATTPPVSFVYSIWAVILAEITFYTPFVVRPLLASFSQLDTGLIEAASSLGAGPLRIIRRIILPEAVPALLAGGSLCLVLTLNEFGIILFIGAKSVLTMPMLIYSDLTGLGDQTAAAIVAVISVVLSLGLSSLYRFLLSRLGGDRAGVL
jgi:2-aminoethylphosphonate transport system permease protein